jgi:GxxExxY protein
MSSNTRYKEPPEYLDKIGSEVVDAAYKVYRKWGPGLLEHFYNIALRKELMKRGLDVQSEVYLPIVIDDEIIEDSYRIDLLVENEIVVEIKTVEKLIPVHHRQIKTYIKLSNNRLGYLINFNSDYIKDDIHRVIVSPQT